MTKRNKIYTSIAMIFTGWLLDGYAWGTKSDFATFYLLSSITLFLLGALLLIYALMKN